MSSERPYFLPHTLHVRAECELKTRALPFPAVRAFTIRNYGGGERERGDHAHRKQWQALQVIAGRAFVLLEQRDAWSQKALLYSTEDQMLVVPPLTWLTLRLHAGSQVLVLASGAYDEADYIRHRSEWEQR